MAIYGYARVSTDGQTLAAQEAQLRTNGCDKVFSEKVSGASAANRPELIRVLAELQDGDVLLVTRLDRLARSTRDLLNILDTIAKAGAGFRSLSDHWADTTNPHGKLMVVMLAGIAEFERSLILARTSDGRARAKAAGKRFGRKPKLNDAQRDQVRERRRNGETLAAIAASYGVHSTSIGRLA
jgi:DNA invertase Pin-like site-specific DNA recombinase